MADPGFPLGGGANILFCQIFPKTAWNWKNLDPGGTHPSCPHLRSATEYIPKLHILIFYSMEWMIKLFELIGTTSWPVCKVKTVWTRKHSSRMRTACSLTISCGIGEGSVQPPTLDAKQFSNVKLVKFGTAFWSVCDIKPFKIPKLRNH